MLCRYLLFIVQIVLESLPISSSAHVQLMSSFLSFDNTVTMPPLLNGYGVDSFLWTRAIDHLMHIPTALVLIIYFRHRWTLYVRALMRSLAATVGMCFRLGLYMLCADSMTVLLFMCINCLHKTTGWSFPLPLGLFITMITLYLLYYVPTKRISRFTLKSATILGLVQGIALLAGISRFASVYAAACWLGMPHRRAFECTWLIQLPLIVAAAGHAVYVLSQAGLVTCLVPDVFAICGISCATICSYGLLYLVDGLGASGALWVFSYYMLFPFVVSLWLY